jgi:hypothetical protein
VPVAGIPRRKIDLAFPRDKSGTFVDPLERGWAP